MLKLLCNVGQCMGRQAGALLASAQLITLGSPAKIATLQNCKIYHAIQGLYVVEAIVVISHPAPDACM